MATFYLDFEGGNDANAGTSFATRWKTITNGATAARIAPGDEIRIMASPDPTSIGSATWNGDGRPLAVNVASSTNTTPITITTSAAHGLVAGDYVMVASHAPNTNANGVWKVGTVSSSTTFEILQINGSNTTGNASGGTGGNATKINNCIVKTASPLVQNIALCGGEGQKPLWTVSTNVTTTRSTSSYKEGYSSPQIAINATFTTGKAAYYTLPATLDLSSYQQVSFWAILVSGTVGAAGQAYIALCSDTTGDTVVHQCPIPNLGMTGAWTPVTVDLGTNLSSTINSVALYIATDVGAQTFQFDNIIACKASSSADSVTLQSLISKSDGSGTEAWRAVQSINYDAIMLGNANSVSANSSNVRGYYGTTETVTTYKRETIKTTVATSSTAQISVLNDSGTSSNPIVYSGGWNRTDMSTQTGQTWYDGLNGNGTGIFSSNVSYNTVDRVNLCRYTTGVQGASANTRNIYVPSIHITACTTSINISTANNWVFDTTWTTGNNAGVTLGGVGHYFGTLYADNGGTNAVNVNASMAYVTINSLQANNTLSPGLSITAPTQFTINELNVNKCSNSAITISGGQLYINSGTLANNVGGISYTNSPTLYLNNLTIAAATEFSSSGNTPAFFAYSNRHDNTDGNNWVFQTAGTVNQQTAVVDSPATTAWKMNPTYTYSSVNAPVQLKLGTVVCAASSLVTVTARMRRSDTGLTMRLACPGGQISGVSSTVYSDMTAAADTWETVTITFTPTKAGAVDIYAHAFGGTTYSGYVCNLTASQA